MSPRSAFIPLVLVCLIAILATPLAAQESGTYTVPGRPGEHRVYPVEMHPKLLPPGASIPKPQLKQREEAPEPETDVPKAEFRRLKSLGKTELGTGGKEIHLDGTPSPLAPNLGTNFDGLAETVWIPYDAALAVGPNDVVIMTNSQWMSFDRTGGVRKSVTQFTAWWPNGVGGGAFDPKCFYDAVADKFVMIAVSKSSTQSLYHISVSQTGDPTGAWWTWDLNARLDGSTSSNNWADFPDVGYDDNAVYITSNQFTLSGNLFQYGKIRVLSKAQLYSGAASLNYTDFIGMQNADATAAFTVKPSRSLTPTATEYLINNRSSSGSNVTLWRITGAPAAPVLTRQATITVGAYSIPPDAPQPGTSTLVATNDCRIQDVFWRNGKLHAAFAEAFSSRAAARYLQIDTGANTALKDITYTQTGVHYYFPVATEDAAGNVYLVLSRSSSTEFASVYHTGMIPSDTTLQASALVKAGVATHTSGRWGDYNAVANDPANNLAIVGYAGWANTAGNWATRVFNASFGGSGSAPTLTSISPNNGTQNTTVSVTLTGTNLASGMTVNAGAGITVNNLNVPGGGTSATANFVIASSAATGARNINVTTGAGTSNSVSFTVNSAGSPPTLSAANPNRIVRGVTTNITFTGTNFVAPASINVAGGGVTVQNIVVVNSTTITADFVVDIAAVVGDRATSITTPFGTSGSVNVRIHGVPVVTSISPVSGNPGATAFVTILGSNFNSAGLQISGSGITFSNFLILQNATKITANFVIAAGAAPGPRDVRVTNIAGASSPVIFTVNGPLSTPVLSTLAPSNGDPGTTVPVTLTGQYFVAGTTINPGSGITVNNLTLTGSTQINANFVIGSGATAGARNVTVTTSGGTSGAQTFTVNGTAAPLNITTTSLPGWTQNLAGYNATLQAAGGTSPYTWSISVGALPSGLLLDTNTGAITGQPTASGTFNFTALVTDNASQTDTRALSITVNPALVITSAAPPNGQVGAAYSHSYTSSGGTGTITWSVTTGALPGGVTLNSTSGALSGPPNASGTFSFTVTATDSLGATASQPASVTISPAPTPVTITTPSLPSWTQNFAGYNSTLQASGGTPGYTWSLSAGALPNGLLLDTNTGAITGQPTVAGTFNFTAKATDTLGAFGTRALSITVNPAVAITSGAPPNGQVGVAYNHTYTSSGGTGAITWNVSAGALPGGLILNGATGLLSGPPNASGTFNFTVTATDSLGATASQPASVTISGTPPPAPALNPLSPNKGQQGTSVAVTFSGTNFVPGNTSINTTAPGVTFSNVNFTSATAGTALFNIPAGAAAGDYTVTVTTPGGTSNTRAFSIYGTPTVTNISPASGNRGSSFTVTFTGTNFLFTTIQFSGTGITASNRVNNASYTQFTVTFTIAAGAPVGPQNVTLVSNYGAGTSNAVTFTVN